MIKQSFRYNQTAATLLIEGLPDISDNTNSESIGILSSWKLNLVGFPQLEGRREHLECLMSVVLPYARHSISGIKRSFGSSNTPIQISPLKEKHQIVLRSSKEEVKPLVVTLDDAELSDLVRCLDELKLDQRVTIKWVLEQDRGLTKKELAYQKPILKIFLAPLLGLSTFLVATFALVNLPLPLEEDTIKSTTNINKFN